MSEVSRGRAAEFIPEEFVFTFDFARYMPIELKWAKNHFELDGVNPDVAFSSSPDTQAWQSFWEKVDKLGIWDWHANYDDPGVLDGVSWELSMRYHERVIQSCGTNSFPGVTSEQCEYTPTFMEFMKAVTDLTRLNMGIFLTPRLPWEDIQ